MKRGVVWLLVLSVLVIALLPAVCATNTTVGTFKKSAGQNWTADSHDFGIVLREKENPFFVYLNFDSKVEGINRGECASFQNYRVCFLNSSLGSIFDPETRRTPYVYEIKITAITADATATITVEKTKLLVGEETSAELRIKSDGDLPIRDMMMRLSAPALEFKSVSSPCRLVNGVILFSDPMSKEDEAICNFKLSPTGRNLTTLQPTLNFSDGRKNQLKKGSSVSIDSRASLITLRLANTSMPLGSIVNGMVNINNTDEMPLTVTGDISVNGGEIMGLQQINLRLESKSSIGLPFSVRLTRTGNISVTANVTIERGSTRLTTRDRTTIRVSVPAVKLKYFGQLTLEKPGPANVQVEMENKGTVPLHNVTLTFHPPAGMTMPVTSPPVSILPGRNEQLYVGTVTVPFNDTIVIIPLNITLATELGEELTLNSNLTLRTGKATKKLLPATPKPGSTTTAPSKPAASNTSSASKTAQTPSAAAAAQANNINTLLIIITVALVAGAVFWFLSMAAMGRGPKKADNDF